MRWVAAAVCAAVMAAFFYLVPDQWTNGHDTAWIVGILVVYFICGALVGRWWAALLAFLPVALAVPLGVHDVADGTPAWAWALFYTVAFLVWVMLAGVLVGRWTRSSLMRRPRLGGGTHH